MKRTLLLFGSLLTFLLIASSCVKDEYDWDNINKEWNLPVGNIPLGDFETITVESLFPEDFRENILIGEDNILQLRYSDSFEIEKPHMQMPDIADVSIETVNYPLPSSSFQLPAGESIDIVVDDNISYTINDPFFEGKNWSVNVESVDFKTCDFLASVSLPGFLFHDAGTAKAYLELLIDFPQHIVLNTGETSVRRVVYLNELNNGRYTFPAIGIEQYSYTGGQEELTYTARVIGGDNTTITGTGSFSFDMTFSTKNVVPEYVFGDVTFEELVEGSIRDIFHLDAFSTDNQFLFDDVYLFFDMETNLGAKFEVDIRELRASNDESSVTLSNVSGEDGFVFLPPNALGETKKTSYMLGNNNLYAEGYTFIQSDITPLFEIIPNSLDYKAFVSNANQSKSGYYPFENLVIENQYTLVAPFKFKELNLLLADTVVDVFSSDMIDYLFFKESKLIVEADEIDVNIDGSNDNLLVLASVSLLDRHFNHIDVEVTPIRLSNGKSPLEIVINIEESDIPALSDVRHLSFDFNIQSVDAHGNPVTIRSTDSISVKGVKIKSTVGINIDIDDL